MRMEVWAGLPAGARERVKRSAYASLRDDSGGQPSREPERRLVTRAGPVSVWKAVYEVLLPAA